MKLLNLFNWIDSLVSFFTFNVGGSKGGGGSSGPQTSTSYSTNLPEYAKPYYEELLKQTGQQVYSTDASGTVTGVKPYTPYPGERVASFTPEQLKVQSEVAGMTTPGGFAKATGGLDLGQTMAYGTGLTGIGQALGYRPGVETGGTFSPAAASYYSSPYQTAVTDIAVREAERKAAMDKSAGALGSIGRGTFGGARQALLQAEQGRNAAQNIADIRARGAESGYLNAQQMFQQDQARRLQAAQMNQQAQQYQAGLGKDLGLAGLTTGLEASKAQAATAATEQTNNLERLKAQAASGAEKQALQQEIDNVKYQQFMDQQNYQKQQLDYLSNILRGNAAALGSTQVSYAPAPSLASQLGGLGLAGLGLYGMLNKG
jgi:hypothetical protein